MTADIRRYLERVLPWPPLGNPNSYKSISYTFTPQTPPTDGKFPVAERAVQTLDELVQLVEETMRNRGSRDIYVSMSTQRNAIAKVASNGRAYTRAVRTQQNALELRSLFADIDAGNKGYATTGEAVRALIDFCDAISLPRPQVLVASGSGGVHAYWCLDRALPVPEWQPLANALANAIRLHGMMCDTQCTVDSVRLLRVPGTLNHKTATPQPVTLHGASQPDFTVEQVWAALAPFAVASPATVTPGGNLSVLPQRTPLATSELAAGIEARQARPVVLADVARECGFIREALDTGGAAYNQPLWNLTTLVSVFAENGREMAHKMAEGHPGYTTQSTDDLYARKERERDQKNLGWPACQSIAAAGCVSCNSCPHLSAGKSPLHHGRAAAATALKEPDLPPGYHRMSNGLIVKRTTDPSGNVDFPEICAYPMDNGWLQLDPWTLHFDTVIDRPTHIQIPIDVLARREAMFGLLLRQGFSLQAAETIKLQEFFVSWIQTLQKQKAKVITAEPFGWINAGAKLDGFAFNGTIYSPSGDRPAALPDDILAHQYSPSGDLDVWKKTARITTDQRRPALDAILASAFAGPLVRLTGHSGFVLSCFSSESGLGKSTAVDTATAVWGNPRTTKQGLTDTSNSLFAKVASLRHLPVYWDEIKEEEQYRRFVQIAFNITQGKEKSRLNAQSGFRGVASWQTLMLAASNDSIMDHIERSVKTSVAGLLRVFEWVVPPGVQATTLSPGWVQREIENLERHRGQAGLVYARFLGENHERVAREVAKIQTTCEDKLKATQDERFWVAAIATLIAGAKFANEIGLTDIDLPGLTKFLGDALKKLRKERLVTPVDMALEANVASVLTRFLKTVRARNMLITNITLAGRGRPLKGAVQIVSATDRLDAIYAQLSIQDKVLRMDTVYLRDWLVKNSYSPSVVMGALRTKYGAREVIGRLGGGTALTCGTERLVEIHLAGTPIMDDLAGLINDDNP